MEKKGENIAVNLCSNIELTICNYAKKMRQILFETGKCGHHLHFPQIQKNGDEEKLRYMGNIISACKNLENPPTCCKRTGAVRH